MGATDGEAVARVGTEVPGVGAFFVGDGVAPWGNRCRVGRRLLRWCYCRLGGGVGGGVTPSAGASVGSGVGVGFCEVLSMELSWA
jgi:hypothetical protein